MIEVRVASLGIDSSTQSPIVILKEKGGKRYLPIWIGHSEASAIATELAGVKFSRPLSHDLMKSLVKGLKGTCSQVVISALKDNTYYAQVFLKAGDDLISIDARPSDSIALALRLKAPIFANETLLNEVGKVDEDDELEEAEESGPEPYDPQKLKDPLRNMNPAAFGQFTLGD